MKEGFDVVKSINSTKIDKLVDAISDAKGYKDKAQLSASLFVEDGSLKKHLQPIAERNERQVHLLSKVMDELYSRMPDISIVVSTMYTVLSDMMYTWSKSEDIRIAALASTLYKHMEVKHEWLMDIVEAYTLLDAVDSIQGEVHDEPKS